MKDQKRQREKGELQEAGKILSFRCLYLCVFFLCIEREAGIFSVSAWISRRGVRMGIICEDAIQQFKALVDQPVDEPLEKTFEEPVG
ncbi:hypothetical protein ACLOJK_041688 [Asimina triloba]